MNRRKIIIAVMTFAAVVICVIRIGIVPANQSKQAKYGQTQTDSLTHDIAVIRDLHVTYVGDISNVIQLFNMLPLNNIPMMFQIDPDNCALTVNYLDTVWNVGEEKVERDLIYNSVAAMAVIDNLTAISYEFSGAAYSFERKEMENVFSSPLCNMLKEDDWNEMVQAKLYSSDFVEQFFKNI